MQADIEITSVEEVGLKLPDGTEIWPPLTWHGRPVDTHESRLAIVEALAASATNLGMRVDELLNGYSWLVREKQIITVTRHLESTSHYLTAFGILPNQEPETLAGEDIPPALAEPES